MEDREPRDTTTTTTTSTSTLSGEAHGTTRLQLRETFAVGFNNEEFCDVELVITSHAGCVDRGSSEDKSDNNKRRKISSGSILVNSFFLSMQSGHFKRLLGDSGGKESSKRTIELLIDEGEHQYFEDMIRAVFTGELLTSRSPSDIVKVLHQCEKYNVPSVAEACNRLLRTSNIAKNYEEARDYFRVIDAMPHLADDEAVTAMGAIVALEFNDFEVILREYCHQLHQVIVDEQMLEEDSQSDEEEQEEEKLEGSRKRTFTFEADKGKEEEGTEEERPSEDLWTRRKEKMRGRVKEFLSLTPLALRELCKSELLRVSAEDTIFFGVTMWDRHNPQRGLDEVADSLMVLHYERMQPEFVLNVVLCYNVIEDSLELNKYISRCAFKSMLETSERLTTKRVITLPVHYDLKATRQMSSSETGHELSCSEHWLFFRGDVISIDMREDGDLWMSLVQEEDVERRVQIEYRKVIKTGTSWIEEETTRVSFSKNSGASLISVNSPYWGDDAIAIDGTIELRLTFYH